MFEIFLFFDKPCAGDPKDPICEVGMPIMSKTCPEIDFEIWPEEGLVLGELCYN